MLWGMGRPAKHPIVIGAVYQRWTVLAATRLPNGRRAALVRCSCAAATEKVVDFMSLVGGRSLSCGCHNREVASQNAYERNEVHGNTWAVKHGLSGRVSGRHAHYDRWAAMMDRCYNSGSMSAARYYERGIRVADEWHDPSVFCAWVDENLGPCPEGSSFDRIDNGGNYMPGNVRWATAAEQAANRG